MSAKCVVIYGKDGCPYTADAREQFAGRGYAVQYHNVKADAAKLSEMLNHSGGQRRVPVIVEDGKATVGFGGS